MEEKILTVKLGKKKNNDPWGNVDDVAAYIDSLSSYTQTIRPVPVWFHNDTPTASGGRVADYQIVDELVVQSADSPATELQRNRGLGEAE